MGSGHLDKPAISLSPLKTSIYATVSTGITRAEINKMLGQFVK